MLMRGYTLVVRVIAVCLLLPLLLSCSSLGKSKKDDEAFIAAVQNLNTAIRWQEYKIVASSIAPQLRDGFWNLADGLQKYVRVMDFEIRRSSCDEQSLSGEATLCYRYYQTNSPLIQTKTVHERYIYLEKEETWQLVQHDLESLLP